jgi:hypothetical protein
MSGGMAEKYKAKEGMLTDELRGLVDPTGSRNVKQWSDQSASPQQATEGPESATARAIKKAQE